MPNSEDKNEYRINVTDDPLTNFLFKDYFRLIVVMFFMVGVFPALLGLYYNTIVGIPSNIINKDIITPLIKDYLGQILSTLVIAVLILTKNLFDKVADVFSSLPKKQILKINDTDYIDFFKDFQKDFNDELIFYVCLFIVPNLIFTPFVFSPFAFLKPIYTEGMWFNKELFPLSWAYWFLILYFLWFALSLLVWKVYIIVKYIRRLGRFDLNIQIMHPDRCGGFKSIGDLCLNIDMIFFAVGLAFASMTYFISLEDQPQLLIYLVLYICVSFFFFFYPVANIHNAMQKCKIEVMNKISAGLENHAALYKRTIDKGGNVDKEALKKIQDILEINREISKIPTWPFDSEMLWKFGTTTSVPVITVIFKIIGIG